MQHKTQIYYQTQKKQIRNYKQIDSTKLSTDLNRIDWTYEVNDDFNQYGSNFLNVFNQLLDIHAPLKSIKPPRAKIKQKSKPWINDNIIKLIKAKDKVHARYIKETDISTKQTILNDYKKKKNEITKQIRIAKKAFYNEFFEKNSKNVKKLWSGINKILNKTNKSNDNPVCIEINNDGQVQTITETKRIAEEFNKHYTTVAEKNL